MFPHRHPNLNGLWPALLLEELWRLGVRDLCIAPGSRSAPLVLIAAELDKLEKHVHFDERGLGFYALGLAKSTNRPVAVITTSGSAVANLYPALVEARQSGVPLVLMTADRPPELIGCGANQAINQHGIFAQYPEASLMLPVPDKQIACSWLLSNLDHAFARSCAKGLPLHINCMFREPLYPDGQVHDFSDYLHSVQSWLTTDLPYKVYSLPESPVYYLDSEWTQVKGIIVAGRLSPYDDTAEIVQLANRLGWPLVTDLQSQLHGGKETIKYVDLVLTTIEGKALFAQATHVIQFGGHLISKRLDQFLSKHHWQHYWLVNHGDTLLDPGHNQTRQLSGSIGNICRVLIKSLEEVDVESPASNALWKCALDRCTERVSTSLLAMQQGEKRLTERWLGQRLLQNLGKSTNLFVGNSLAVRLLDMFSSARGRVVFANRGASGIDGLIATAAGCSSGLGEPLVAVIGDLSFLHDLNSLALLRRATSTVALIVINNDGGGIFSMLPGEKSESVAKDYFQTPHGLSCREAAGMFSLGYEAPITQTDFELILSKAVNREGCTLIEVRTEPGEAAAQIKEAIRLLEAEV